MHIQRNPTKIPGSGSDQNTRIHNSANKKHCMVIAPACFLHFIVVKSDFPIFTFLSENLYYDECVPKLLYYLSMLCTVTIRVNQCAKIRIRVLKKILSRTISTIMTFFSHSFHFYNIQRKMIMFITLQCSLYLYQMVT